MSFAETFKDKSILVTGAASGMGFEIARQTAAAGANVLLTDIVEDVHAAAEQIGSGAQSMIVDVRDREQIAAAIAKLVADNGRLDFAYNNAGVAIFGEVEEVSLDLFEQIIDVNLRGVAYGVKLAYDQMRSQGGGGHIVNTASTAGFVPVPLQTHYCATKHGVVGMGKTLSLEGERHGIHVTTFCPGFVQTGMMTNHTLRGTMDIPDPTVLVPFKPISAEVAVQRLLNGVVKKKLVVVTPWYARIGVWFEGIAPQLSHHLHRYIYMQTIRRARRAKKLADNTADKRSKMAA